MVYYINLGFAHFGPSLPSPSHLPLPSESSLRCCGSLSLRLLVSLDELLWDTWAGVVLNPIKKVCIITSFSAYRVCFGWGLWYWSYNFEGFTLWWGGVYVGDVYTVQLSASSSSVVYMADLHPGCRDLGRGRVRDGSKPFHLFRCVQCQPWCGSYSFGGSPRG